jgi:hypothetical protein
MTCAARKLLERHFKNIDPVILDMQVEVMIPSLIVNAEYFDTASKNAPEHIKALKRHLRGFLTAYNELPPSLRREIKGPSQEEIWRFAWKFFGENPANGTPFAKHVKELYPRQKGALHRIEQKYKNDTMMLHHHQISEHTIQKAALFDFAAELWERFASKKAPKKPSPGTKFYEFLAELIQFCGEKKWSVNSVIRANRTIYSKVG